MKDRYRRPWTIEPIEGATQYSRIIDSDGYDVLYSFSIPTTYAKIIVSGVNKEFKEKKMKKALEILNIK